MYSCIFSIGSILEGLIDELFEREDQKLWKSFCANQNIQNKLEKNSPLLSSQYPDDTTLGRKVVAFRIMSENEICVIPKSAILQMIIISQYRDLIHPQRSLNFEFLGNSYVANVLFTFIAGIAHYWWPKHQLQINKT
jgi:hypothetical protein